MIDKLGAKSFVRRAHYPFCFPHPLRANPGVCSKKAKLYRINIKVPLSVFSGSSINW
jgi:hypothetical protein